MDTLQERLLKFLKSYGITMQYFEQQCNIAQGLGKKLSEKSYSTTFKRIAEGFPQLNIEWLKTGKGEMTIPSTNINMTRHNSPGDNDVYGNILKNTQKPPTTNEKETEASLKKELSYLRELLKEKERLISEKDERISELTERINELKERIEELKEKQ